MFAKRLLYKVLLHNKGSKMVTNLDLQVVLHYGIPYTSSILAFDPIQRLLAVGTLDGRIKIVGGDNIEGLLISPKRLPYKYLEFLQNQGVLIGVTNDNEIQVWDLEHRRLACSFQWETNITAFAIICGTSLMYIGDENGMLYVLRYDSEAEKLLKLPYNIPAKSMFESAGISCPIYQSVVGILPQPSSSGTRVLVAYESGVMILWDVSESHVITIRGYTDLQLKEEETEIMDNQNDEGNEQEEKEICSLCWVTSSGSFLAVGYINGDILLWDFSLDLSKKQQSASSLSSKAVVKLQLASGNRRLPVIVLNWSANASLNDKGGQLLIYGGDDMGSEEVLTVLNLEWASGVDSLKCLSRADLKLSGSFADMILIPNAGAIEHSSSDALFVLTNPGQLNVYDGALLPVLKIDEEKYGVEAEKFPMAIPSIDPCITVTKICLLDPGSNISKKILKADAKRHDESPTLSCGTRWPLTGGVPFESVSKNGVKRMYIAAYQDGSVRIWDATYPTLSLILFLQAKVPGMEVDNQCASVSALDFCSTSLSLAVGNDCGLVRIYKLLPSTDESSIHIVSQTAHEVFAARHGDGYHCTAIFLFSNSFIQTLAFTRNGQKLAVGFKSGQVAMLDLNSWSIVFCTECSASALSPVISITFLVDPQLNSNTEVILILKKDAHFVIMDSISGELVSSRQMHTKKEPAAISMYVIDGDNHIVGITNEKPSQSLTDEKSLEGDTPSNECSNDASKSNEPLLDLFLLLCHDDSLWFGPLKSVIQGSSDYICKANLAKRCCWSAVFKKRNEDGLGLILLYETGDLEMRSLPDLEVLAENSLMSILRWSFKTNMEKSMSSYANGLIAMVNGCELAMVSLLECENDFRIPESLPCLHDKVVAAAAASSLSANQKKRPRAGYGILGGILKGLKGNKSENDPTMSISIEMPNSVKLEEFFSKDLFVNTSATIASDNEGELSIDDIEIDDVVPATTSSTTVNKHVKSSENEERERLFQGATVDNKPRIRTTQEIMTQYRFNGDAQAAAAHAKDKLMERQEKLERISLRTAELQEGAQNFAELAHELARRMEKKKWWQI